MTFPRRPLAVLAFCLAAALPAGAQAPRTPEPAPAPVPEPAPAPGRRVALETNQGRIVLELYPRQAPHTVANFLAYARAGHYSGTVFHRAIAGVLVQGGGFTV